MSDYFSEDQIDYFSKNTVRVDFLVKLDFTSETVRCWNGHYELTSGGEKWKPLHGIATIDGIEYANTTSSQSVTFSLNGLPNQNPDILAKALEGTEETVQQLVTVYLQIFDEHWQPVGSPIAIWYGFMQPPEITTSEIGQEEGNTQTISMTAENIFYNRSKPPYGRYTDRDQQSRFEGDKFFQFVAALKRKLINYPDY